MRCRLMLLLMIVVVVFASGPGGWGGIAAALGRSAQDDNAAVELLLEVKAAYAALKAYADEGEIRITAESDETLAAITQPARLALERPGRLDLQAGIASLRCDGTQLMSVVNPTMSYTMERAPERILPATITERPAGALLVGGSLGTGYRLLLSCLLETDRAEVESSLANRLRLLPDREVNGQRTRVIRIEPDSSRAPELELEIDAQTKRITSIQARSRTPGEGGGSASGAVITWVAGTIVESVPAERFDVAPPAGYTKLEARR